MAPDAPPRARTHGLAESPATDRSARRAVREGRALGSQLRLTAPREDEARLDRAWGLVRATFDAVDRAMSRFREDSEVTALHRRRGGPAFASRYLLAALAAADRAGRVTGGLFDARVILDLERLGSVAVPQAWGDGGADRGSPARLVRRTGRAGPVELLAPVDLGGIGKGLALRWAARRATTVLGSSGFLLEAGGDIVSRGTSGDGPWAIAIEDPTGGPTPLAVCELGADEAIATSSTLVGRWRDPTGRAVHHLIDPRTGEPGGEGLLAVTVQLPDPAWAEVWAKALFLEGPGGIAATARGRGLAAWWVDDAGDLSMTPAARQRTSWVHAESALAPRIAASR